MGQWFKESFWRNLVDMHIPDWNPDFMSRFSPDQYADFMSEAEVDTAELYAGNCLGICFWPTRAGHMHNGLAGQDIIGPTLEQLHKKGIRPLVYFNIWSRWAFDTHPHWRLQRINGTHTTRDPRGGNSRFGQCCLNAPGYQAYVKDQIEDLAEHYTFAGLWIDMLGWFGTVCCCPDCRRRYYEETGKEIPERIDWFDPDWVQFQRKREAWLVELASMVRKTLHAIKPECTITFNCAAWQRGWSDANTQAFMDQSDYLAGDFYGHSLLYTSICKFLNNASQNKPIEFMTSRCVSLYDHTTVKTNRELAFSAYGSFAHNSAFVFIDAINPDGTLNQRFYQNMGELHRSLKKYQNVLSPDADMLRDVTFLFNFESFINLEANGISLRDMAEGLYAKKISGSPTAKMMNIARAMIASHLAYDLSCSKELKKAVRLSQLIVLPGQHVLLEEDLTILDDYVREGGCLIITGQSGIVDRDGHQQTDFAHASLSGVHACGKTTQDVTYMRPADGFEALFHPYDRQFPLSLDAHSMLIEGDEDVTVLARLTLPYSHSQEINRFGSAISNPPGLETAYPAVTVRRHGQGRVMYLAAPIEEGRHDAQQTLFARLIQYMMAKPSLLETNAPAWLECLIYKDMSKKRYLIYACKIMSDPYEGAAHHVRFSVKLPEKVSAITDVSTGLAVPFSEQNGRLIFQADCIADFSMYLLDTAATGESAAI